MSANEQVLPPVSPVTGRVVLRVRMPQKLRNIELGLLLLALELSALSLALRASTAASSLSIFASASARVSGAFSFKATSHLCARRSLASSPLTPDTSDASRLRTHRRACGSPASETKLVVTAIVGVSRFRTACHQPRGTKMVSPAETIPSRGR